MTAAPYCLPCNRHHLEACPPGERRRAAIAVALLNTVMVGLGLLAGAIWVGLDIGLLPW